jgi:hypothetical protein
MLVKILIVCAIIALIVFTLNTAFKFIVGLTTWFKFKDKLDDLDFAVKVEDEVLPPENNANEKS